MQSYAMAYSQRVYWDSSIWFSWLLNETWRPNNEFDGVLDCVEAIEKNEILIFTGDVIYSELSRARLDDEPRKRFDALTKRRNVRVAPTNMRIGELCIEIKTFYRKRNKADHLGEVTDFDAQHLATAIQFSADAFYTFDAGAKRGRSLLSLSANVAGYRLRVCKPPVGQMRLGLQ